MPAIADFALVGEEIATGHRHGDNVIPCLYGGLQCVYSVSPLKTINLPVPGWHIVLLHPHQIIETRFAREKLKAPFALADIIKQTANLAGFMSALYEKDEALLEESLTDHLVEPRRAALIPGFYAIQQAALHAGAFACSISGAGPTLFALAKSAEAATQIGAAMQHVCDRKNGPSDLWISAVRTHGCHINTKATIDFESL